MNWQLKIKRRNQNQWLVLFVFMLPFGFGLLNKVLGIPTTIRYSIDLIWGFLLLTMLVKPKTIAYISTKGILKWITVFVIYTFILYVINYQSVFYYLWGFRNNFRFYVYFLACMIYLKHEDAETYISWFDKVFWVNVLVALIQYFMLDIRQDFLGGIFGVEKGCNGYLNIFQVIIVTKSLVYYLNKKESLISCVTKCSMALLIAAFAELKFFFVEFGIIIVLVVLLTKFSWKKILIILGGSIGIIIGTEILINIFPSLKDVMSLRGLLEIAVSDKGYTSSGDMNRLTVFSMSSELFLKTGTERLFGLGLGNCDYSEAFGFLMTPFYRKYSLIHYTWLSTAYIFLELGVVGIIFYFGFFALVFVEAHRKEKSGYVDIEYCQLAKIIALMCIAIAFYNSTLRTEAAYMIYFVLAIPFWAEKTMVSEK